MMMQEAHIPRLPLDQELESKKVLKQTTEAHKALAELKGVSGRIPNEKILINTLALQEAKDSSAIENIMTTHDELYQADVDAGQYKTLASKEVHHYAEALNKGFEIVRKTGLLTENDILNLQAIIVEHDAGYRRQAGTVLKNEQTGQTVYTPPQHPDDIVHLMSELVKFLNTQDLVDWDPLVKMAVVHNQFESIHPFYDGNGRTGRIINVLYLVKEGLLDLPVLYLSRYINQNKSRYYKLLQTVRETGNWEAWVLYMLEGIEQTSRQTIRLIQQMEALMLKQKHLIRKEEPRIYSQDLLNNLFMHPYTKTAFTKNNLMISRKTASNYLNKMVELDILEKQQIGKENYFINKELFELLANAGNL